MEHEIIAINKTDRFSLHYNKLIIPEVKGVNMLYNKNNLLSVEQYRYLVEKVSVPAQSNKIGRSLFEAENMGGLGMQMYSYDRLTESDSADVDYVIISKLDTVNKTRESVSVPIIQKSFRVELRDMMSNAQYGEPIDGTLAADAGRKIRDQEETLLLIGNTDLGINGLYGGAGNTVAGADFGTYGNATVTLVAALSALFADNIYGPFDLVLHPTQWAQLAGSDSTTGTPEWTKIMNLLIGGASGTPRIMASDKMTAGTGMVVSQPGGKDYIKLGIAMDLTTKDYDIRAEATGFTVFEALVPVIKESNAICTLTGI